MSEGGIVSGLIRVSLFSCILLPPACLMVGMPSVRLEEGLVFGFLGLYILWRRKRAKELFSPCTTVDFCFALLAVSILLSICFGGLVLNQPVIMRDFFELVKVLKYYLFYRLSLFSVLKGYGGRGRWDGFLFSVGIIAALITVMQFFDLLAVNLWLSPLYEGGEIRGDPFLHRAIGTFGNPNISGYFFAMLLLMAFVQIVTAGKVLKPLFWGGGVVIIACAFLVTESRTAVLALPVGMLAAVLLRELGKEKIDYKKMSLNLGIVAGIVLCLGAIIFFLPLDYLKEIKDAFYARSMLARYEVWSEAFNVALQSPLFGWGPAKVNMPMGIDNEYLLHFRRYGLLGLSLLLYLYASVVKLSCRLYRDCHLPEENMPVSLLMVGTVFIVLVVGLTNSAFNNLRYMPVFWIVAGNVTGRWILCRIKRKTVD